jgi:hypothetical protein
MRTTTTAPRSSFGHTRLIACVLTLALWFASTLGLVHGTVHGMPHVVPQAQELPSAAAVVEHAAPSTATARLLAALFGDHHDGDAQCRLYDQLSHGPAAIACPMVVLPPVWLASTFAHFESEVLLRRLAPFQARAPPPAR